MNKWCITVQFFVEGHKCCIQIVLGVMKNDTLGYVLREEGTHKYVSAGVRS